MPRGGVRCVVVCSNARSEMRVRVGKAGPAYEPAGIFTTSTVHSSVYGQGRRHEEVGVGKGKRGGVRSGEVCHV